MKLAILGTRGIPNNYGGFEQCAEVLAAGLQKKGYEVTVYNPSFHSYNKRVFDGVTIKKIYSPNKLIGNSASNFVFDYLCFKDAVKSDYDIILELGLITSSPSIIFVRHRGKIIVTNIDGIEWRRKKWNFIIRFITRNMEKLGVRFSDYLIADNLGIVDYLKKTYDISAKYIAYGADILDTPDSKILNDYNLKAGKFILCVGRIEPENNYEMIFKSYVKAKLNIPLILIGNHLTKFGDYLKDKFKNENIYFFGTIYDKKILDNLRYYSKLYIHGHSVGGTNPSLIEAMSASALVLIHRNKFNLSVLTNNELAFSNSDELKELLLDSKIISEKKKHVSKNLKIIKEKFTWEKIIDDYETFFLSILN
ncbi:MAG: DUF1972 domain-containing protein [Flavobacteriales bacterium TMED84]|nr:MAG: DUF1972 domain-containing protein [Flavobacteriales bacterium TMED84]